MSKTTSIDSGSATLTPDRDPAPSDKPSPTAQDLLGNSEIASRLAERDAYEVQPGDSWRRIAAEQWGDERRYTELQALNAKSLDRRGSARHLTDDFRLRAGQTLSTYDSSADDDAILEAISGPLPVTDLGSPHELEVVKTYEVLAGLGDEQLARVLDEMQDSGQLDTLLRHTSAEQREQYEQLMGSIPVEDQVGAVMNSGSALFPSVNEYSASRAIDVLVEAPEDQVDDGLASIDIGDLVDNLPDSRTDDLHLLFERSSDPDHMAPILDSYLERHFDREAGDSTASRAGSIRDDTTGESRDEISALMDEYDDKRDALANDLSVSNEQYSAMEAMYREQYAERLRELDERRTLELGVELEHDVVLTADSTSRWSQDDLRTIDHSLEGIATSREQSTLERIHRDDVYSDSHGSDPYVGGLYSSDVITLFDNGYYGAPAIKERLADGSARSWGTDETDENLAGTLSHEEGHDFHFAHPDIHQRFMDLAGWESMDAAQATAGMVGGGLSPAAAQRRVAAWDHEYDNRTNWGLCVREDSTTDDYVYSGDIYNDDTYLRRRRGFIPGDVESPAANDSYGYAATHPDEHFAETYEQMALHPDEAYQDFVELPGDRLQSAQADYDTAAEATANARAAGASQAELDRLEAEEEEVLTRLEAMEEQHDALTGQWELMRTEVFGVDAAVEQRAREELHDIIESVPPELLPEGFDEAAMFERYDRYIESRATPEQIQAMVEANRARAAQLRGE